MEGRVSITAASQAVEVKQVVQIGEALAAPCTGQSLQLIFFLCLLPARQLCAKIQPQMPVQHMKSYSAPSLLLICHCVWRDLENAVSPVWHTQL